MFTISLHSQTQILSHSFFLQSFSEREREREAVLGCIVWRLKLDVCTHYRFIHALFLSHTYAQKSVYLWVYEGQKEREREWASNVHTDSRDDNFIRYLDFFPTHKKLKAATYEWRWADSIKTISKSVLLILPLSEAST